VKDKLLSQIQGLRTHALIFDQADEVIGVLTEFARGRNIASATFSAIGGFRDVALGWFDWQTKDYKRIELNEQVEVLSLLGDISLDAGRPKVHAHVVVGASDGIAHGGHLLEGHVRPTLELFLRETDETLRRAYDPLSKIPLIALG